MAITDTTIENLYRPAYETRAAVTWTVSAVATAVAAAATGLPFAVGGAMTVSSAVMAVLRGMQAYDLFKAKVALAGESFWMLPKAEVDRACRRVRDELWLGRGFRWTATHTERAFEINRQNPELVMPPKWALRLMGRPHDFGNVKGEPWIHGLEPKETDISIPWGHSEGNWSIFGTTGAGKTRLYELLCYQIVKRGDVLIVFDPKYDKDLRSTLIDVCKAAGRPDAFCEFHPAFPTRSVRIDPLKNFSRETEIASRVADILGGDPNDNFISFCWRVMFAITAGLMYVDERPNLRSLRSYIESGPEPLVQRALEKFLAAWHPSWEDMVNSIESQLNSNRKMVPRLKTGTLRQSALVQVYHENVEPSKRRDDINALVSVAEHSREHYGKMIATMVPLLTKLTAKPLDDLLSPDYSDQADEREILDMEKVIQGKRVLYVATDSLSDATVGSAIAGILLADLRAVAGARYNYGTDDSTVRIHILCDEACEIVNAPLIALMNKGRGAGMISYLATQNFSDYIARFGSEDQARMVVGNGNNRLTLRVVDTKTQKYVCENLGTVNIRQTSASTGGGSKTEDGGMEFSGNVGTSVSQKEAELFPAALLGKLPDLQYVAVVSGGKVIKGRIPKLV